MENQSYEQEIDLKDLMFAILHKWRGIIVTAVIVGILAGGYKLGTGLSSKEDGAAAEKAREAYNQSMELYESMSQLYKSNLDTIQAQIQSQGDYIANSVLMKISPYHKNVAGADVFVTVDPQEALGDRQILVSDPADTILRAYESLINSAELREMEGLDIDGIYLKELVTTEVDYEGNSLSIQTTYTDEQGAKALLNALLEELQRQGGELQREFGNHRILIMNETSSVVADTKLYQRQQDAFNTLTALRTSLADKKDELGKMEKPAAPSVISASASLKSGIKYGILGGALGAFLSIFYICAVFLMSDKVNSEKEMKNRFGLKLLGVFAQMPKKRAFSGIDRWLDRLEGKSFKKPEEVYEIVAANVRNYMEENRNIMLLGGASMDRMSEVAKELKDRMPEIEIQIGQDMGTSAETLKRLPGAGQVILVEERGVSQYQELQNQVELIRSLDKAIVGCIVL